MKGKRKKVESKSKTDSLSICPCDKTLKGRPSWIACDKCKQWWHGSCVSLTNEICAIFSVVKLGLKPRGRSHKPFWIPIYTCQDDTTD